MSEHKKLPYIQFFYGDWKRDTQLSRCSVATRGVWFELLCSMHDAGACSLTGSTSDLAWLARCTVKEMAKAIDELRNTQAADVQTNLDRSLTVGCRRLMRKQKASQIARESGSKGGSKTASQRQAIPEYESEDEGVKKVREFCRDQGIIQSDADWFFWKMHACDWTVQRGSRAEKVLDWKATIRAWQRGRFFPSQQRADRYPVSQGRMTPPTPTEKLPPRTPKEAPAQRELTDEEWARQRESVKAHMTDFRNKLRNPNGTEPEAIRDHDRTTGTEPRQHQVSEQGGDLQTTSGGS